MSTVIDSKENFVIFELGVNPKKGTLKLLS